MTLRGTQGGLESQEGSVIVPDVWPGVMGLGADSRRTMVYPCIIRLCLLVACSVPHGSGARWLLLECIGEGSCSGGEGSLGAVMGVWLPLSESSVTPVLTGCGGKASALDPQIEAFLGSACLFPADRGGKGGCGKEAIPVGGQSHHCP